MAVFLISLVLRLQSSDLYSKMAVFLISLVLRLQSSDLYSKMAVFHKQQLTSQGEDLSSWMITWVDPVLESLSGVDRQQKAHVIEVTPTDLHTCMRENIQKMNYTLFSLRYWIETIEKRKMSALNPQKTWKSCMQWNFNRSFWWRFCVFTLLFPVFCWLLS